MPASPACWAITCSAASTPSADVLDSEDFLVSSILLPLGSLVYLLFCVTRWGWGFKNYQAEANAGKGLKVAGWMRWLFMIVLPIMILAIFIIGLIG